MAELHKRVCFICEEEISKETLKQYPDTEICQECMDTEKGWPKKVDCEHDWIGLHGHPAAFECKKCKALRR